MVGCTYAQRYKMIRVISIFIIMLSILWGVDFHRSMSASPTRINPLLATDSASGSIAGWIFNGLLKFDKEGNITTDLAKSYYFEDNSTLIFRLKKGIKWHDGVEFSADDVVFTYNWLMDKKVVTPYKSDFKYVKSVKKLDRYTIEIKYSQPYFKALSIWMMGLIPKHLWENESEPMRSRLNKLPVGTGPYKMKKPFGINERIILYANKDYFEHKPYIDRQIFHYIGDPSTEFMMLKSGKLDIGSLSPLQVQKQLSLQFRQKFAIYEQPSQGYTYLGFNLKRKVFANRELRYALSLAIDKDEIIKLLFFGHGKACYGPFMPASSVYPKDFKPTPYNPKQAKEILKKLGYTDKHPLEFTLITNTGNDIRTATAEIIQQQLLRIGVKMHIRTMEWQAFLNTVVFPANFDAVLLGWSLSLIPDAYSIWHSEGIKKGGFNFVGYKNSEVDRLIKIAQSTIDPIEFAKIYQKIFKLIVNDHPYIFLYIPNAITAVNKKIQGVEPSIIGVEHNFIDWKIKP